ncbi:MAG TPA: hypothetical protein VH682_17695 [Gemmataceae bacterium]|jgi:hypothetical protein
MKFTTKIALSGLIEATAAAASGAAPQKNALPRDYLPPTLSWLRKVESVQMIAAILGGTPTTIENPAIDKEHTIEQGGK